MPEARLQRTRNAYGATALDARRARLAARLPLAEVDAAWQRESLGGTDPFRHVPAWRAPHDNAAEQLRRNARTDA